jgi:hypothetical protein
MKLPYEYRFRAQLPKDICHNLWPELLASPFNEFTGFMSYVPKTKKYIKNTKRRTAYFAKKVVKRLVKRAAIY